MKRDQDMEMASHECFFDNQKHYDCVTKAHRIACRLILVFVLSYFLAITLFWDRNKSDKHGVEIEHQPQLPLQIKDRGSWALMLEKDRQQHDRMKENLELKMLQNINQYRRNRTRANLSRREVPLEVGPVVSLS